MPVQLNNYKITFPCDINLYVVDMG